MQDFAVGRFELERRHLIPQETPLRCTLTSLNQVKVMPCRCIENQDKRRCQQWLRSEEDGRLPRQTSSSGSQVPSEDLNFSQTSTSTARSRMLEK